MATFVKINAVPAEERGAGTVTDRQINLKLDVGKTLALLLIALALLGISAALYFAEKDGPAFGFFALGEAVMVSGFGIVIGTREGAKEAESQLR